MSNWQSDPQFKIDVERTRRGLVDLAIGKFSAALETVSARMITLATEAASESVQLQAARSVIEHLIQVSEFGDIKDRLAEIERRLDEKPKLHDPAGTDRGETGVAPAHRARLWPA